MTFVFAAMAAVRSTVSGHLSHRRAHLKWRFRALRGRLTGLRYRKTERSYNPAAPVVTIGATDRVSGLARSYRYELQRLERERQSDPRTTADRTYILFGQPRGYRRLLATAPEDFAHSYRIGLWATEFETMPPDWRFALNIVHEIWTPSSFCADAIQAETDIPVKVVPHFVSIPDVPPLPRSAFGIQPHQFLGLAIMDLRNCPDRKNPLAHVRAWKLAFEDDPDARLLMKLRFSPRSEFMRRDLMAAIDGAANIALTETVLSDTDVTAFQKMADVFLSLHRSEGYGLNIKEMLEIGVPTIATAWSGNMDFMPSYPHAVPVPYELVPYADRTHHYEGDALRWAEADVAFAAAALRDVRSRWNADHSAPRLRAG